MRPFIVIPTYDEAKNIEKLIGQILSLQPTFNIIVVDDNSPDGTGEIVSNLKKGEDRVHLIRRLAKLGLGTAYIEGFKLALSKGADLIFEMDADLSHDPLYLQGFLDNAPKSDLIIGSRYINGVRVEGWSFSRLMVSKVSNIFVSRIMVKALWDFTSGFRCYHRHVLETIDLEKIHSDGYAFQIEMVHLTYKHGFKILEIPILFKEREGGVSKIDRSIIREAFFITLKFHAQLLKLIKYSFRSIRSSSEYFKQIS